MSASFTNAPTEERMPVGDALTAVRRVLSPNPAGQCYVAAEAVYHLAGGKDAGLTPYYARAGDEFRTHWWIQDAEGTVIDPTFDQFDYRFPYEEGRGCGFLTARPSSKAQALIDEAIGDTNP